MHRCIGNFRPRVCARGWGLPLSTGYVICSMVLFSDASSPTMMSLSCPSLPFSSNRSTGRPTMLCPARFREHQGGRERFVARVRVSVGGSKSKPHQEKCRETRSPCLLPGADEHISWPGRKTGSCATTIYSGPPRLGAPQVSGWGRGSRVTGHNHP